MQNLSQAQTRLGAVAVHRLDLADPAVLELRAEGEKHGADERDRDADGLKRGEADLLGQLTQLGRHPVNLPLSHSIF